jgi:hypothetical protein
MYASAQFFDFLDLAEKFSFLNWKLNLNLRPIYTDLDCFI